MTFSPKKKKTTRDVFIIWFFSCVFFGKLTDETTADKHDNNKPLKSGRNGVMVIENMQENVIHDTKKQQKEVGGNYSDIKVSH